MAEKRVLKKKTAPRKEPDPALLDMLYEKYGGPLIGIADLNKILGFRSRQYAYRLVKQGRYPVKTRIESSRRVADIRDVALYLDSRRGGDAA